jgi:hypothetical protein
MKLFNDVVIYKDPKYKTCYPTTYPVEVLGNKARVINPNPVFGTKAKSHLCKLVVMGRIEDTNLYTLKVNGNYIYMKLKYQLP